ncbi:mucin-17-like isoform X2 [Haliotis cracherodii]
MKIQHLKHAATNRSRSHTEDGDTGLKRQRYSQYFRTKYNGCKDAFDRLSLLALSDFQSSFQVSSVIFHCIKKFADENHTDRPLHIFGLGATAPYSQVLKTHRFKQHPVAQSVDFKNLKEEIKPKTIEEEFDILSSMSNYHWKIDRSVHMLQYFSTGDIKTRKSPASIRNKIIYALRAGCQDKYRSSVKMLSDQYISILPWAPRLVKKRHNDELFGRVKCFANSFILPKPTVPNVTLDNSLRGLQTVEDGTTLHQGPQKQSLLANPVRRETCSVILPKPIVTCITQPTSLLSNSSIGPSQDGSTLHQGPKKRCLLANPVRREKPVTFNNSVILPKPVVTCVTQPTSLLSNSSTGLSQNGCTLHQGPKKQSLLSNALRTETFDNSVILPKPTDTTCVTQTTSLLTISSIGPSQDGSTLHQGPKKRCLLANPVRREKPVTFNNSVILPKPTVTTRVTQTTSLLTNSSIGPSQNGCSLHQGPKKQSLLSNALRTETFDNSVILPKPTDATRVTQTTSLLTNSSIGPSQNGCSLHQGPKKQSLLTNALRTETFDNSVILPKPTDATRVTQTTSLLTNSSIGPSQNGCSLHQGPKKQSLLTNALRRETFDNSVILPKPIVTGVTQTTSLLTNSSIGPSQDGSTLHKGPKKRCLLANPVRRETCSVILPKPIVTGVTQTTSLLTNSSIGPSQDGSTLHKGPKKRCLLANPVRREKPVTFDNSVILPKPTDTTCVTQTTSLLTNSSIGPSQDGSTLHKGPKKRKCLATKPVRQDLPVTVNNSVILPKPTVTTSVALPTNSSTGLSQNGSTLHQGPIQKKCLPTRPVVGDTSVTFNNSILLPLSTVTTSVALCQDHSFRKEVSHDCYIQRGMFKSLSFCKVTLLHEEDDDNTHLQYSWI